MLVKSRSNVFFLLKNLSPNLSPSRDVFVFLEIWSFLWSGGNLVPSLLTATSLQRTQRGGPRFNLVPRDFPGENGRGGDCFTSVPLPLFDSLCVVTSIGRLLGKIYVFLTPSKTDGRVPSQQGVPTTCNLTYWEVSQQRYLQPLLAGLGEATGQNSDLQWGVEGGIETWVWPKGEFIPSGLGKFLAKNSCQIFYTSNPNRHPQLYFSKQHFPSLDISLLPNSHPGKMNLKNIYFFRNRSIGAHNACSGCKKFWNTCWFSYLFILF